jgi:AraC-like DNA-binding protein
MNLKLDQIKNWPELAREAKWSASALAVKCGVSGETVRQHFRKKFGKSPKPWLAAQRQHEAIEILRNATSIKETAECLGYKQPSNFSRQFKGIFGFCPSQQGPAPAGSTNTTCGND